MNKIFVYILVMITIACGSALSQNKIPLYYDAGTYEYIRGAFRDTIYMTDGAEFRHGSSYMKSDTAILVKGEKIVLMNNVLIEDSLYQLTGDRVEYDLNVRLATAVGDSVVIISQKDSLRLIGTNAWYCRDSLLFRMHSRPILEMNYQDTSRLIQIYADNLAFDVESKISYADGNVIINRSSTHSTSERAIMYRESETLLLLGEPVARRNKSEITGDTLIFYSEDSELKQIYVTGNGEGQFKEQSKKDSMLYDISELKGDEVEFNLDNGELDNIKAMGQAYSYYFPAVVDSSEIIKNIVSGDTLHLRMLEGEIHSLHVKGGSEGEYFTGAYKQIDSIPVFTEDTVKYRSNDIIYSLGDSTISLNGAAGVENKTVALKAHRIDFNTARKLVFAFDDSILVDTVMAYIPVILKDGSEDIIGSYMEYSLDTEKGMIVQSKSDYQEAYYSGKELFRREREVYYVDDGTYSTCDAEQPHFHFRSKNMKMIQGDKVIARPVVFYIEKLPLLIFPYYVFPTKSGRHSGILSFKFGNFSRGNRYLSNIGYYWAASEYWDILGAIDYYEDFGISYRSTFRYNQRYKYSGNISASYANETTAVGYNEVKTKRWRFSFKHSHTVSPSFDIRADGTFLSDKQYYTDFSTDLEDRLNRNIRSQISLSKKFKGASLSAQFVHDVALDTEKRTDKMPTITFSLSSRPIFGSPGKNEDGKEMRRWYHEFYAGYRVSMKNYSERTTDSLTGLRSRKKYTTIDHSTSVGPSFTVLKYLKLNPSVSYKETWYKIYQTDQSDSLGIDASTTYRSNFYAAGVRASTDLYGTISPKLFGLEGLRHVLTPSVSYSWNPEFTRHAAIRAYTGAGAGGSKRSALSFNLKQLFQAKVKSGEESKSLTLLTVNSGFSYNYEAVGKKYSAVNTSVSTALLRNIDFRLSMTHDLYKPDTDELNFWSPYLTNLTVTTRFNTSGSLGDYEIIDKDGQFDAGSKKKAQKWTLSVSHKYSESGRGELFVKRNFMDMNLSLTLTPSLGIRYSQSYDFTRDKTVSRRIEVTKDLHCWKGSFYWIPDGSNNGFFFRINVIAIPDIKFEKSESGVRNTFF